jgi:glutaredoxin
LKVTLYTQRGCGLCREAEAMLRRIGGKIQFELAIVDIDAETSAYAKYWDRIPVVALDGEEVAAAPLNERELISALQR